MALARADPRGGDTLRLGCPRLSPGTPNLPCGPVAAAGPYCRNAGPAAPLLVTNSSTVTVLFNSTSHRSGRGLLLSYATSQHPGRGERPPGMPRTPPGCVLAPGRGHGWGRGSSLLTPKWGPCSPWLGVQHRRPPGLTGPRTAPQTPRSAGTPILGRAAGLGPMAAGTKEHLWVPQGRGGSCGRGGAVPHLGVSLPCRPGLLPGSRHPLHPGARQVSDQGLQVVPALASPTLAVPISPWLCPHPSPGCLGCTHPRAFGVQPPRDGEQSGCSEGMGWGGSEP